MDIGQSQNLCELLSQANFHLVFQRINTVLRQPAWLDVAIQDDRFVPGLGQLLRGKHSRRPGSDYENSGHPCPSPTVSILKYSRWHGL